MSAADTIDVDRPPPVATGWTRQKILGHALVGLWILMAAGLVWFLATSWNTQLFEKYGPGYLSGLWVTVSLVAGCPTSQTMMARAKANRMLKAAPATKTSILLV